MRVLIIVLFILCSAIVQAQKKQGIIVNAQTNLPVANANILYQKKWLISDSNGVFILPPTYSNTINLYVQHVAFKSQQYVFAAKDSIKILLQPITNNLEDIVVTGTLKEVNRTATPVPVEIYTSKFLQKNPTVCVFDALQNMNGVRPQINCNVCNTGDIRINGLDGPYTMILIDGMPIVSSLSTVYGLNGIPTSLIDRIEIVKGPASSLYGSEAIGGLINVITVNAAKAPAVFANLMATSYGEYNADIAFKQQLSSKVSVLNGINYFNYSIPVDVNQDGFTDVTLQQRISLFQQWQFNRPNNKLFSLAARYMYEDRWGGQTNWNKTFRGGDSIYGESIYTNRWELLGKYQLPFQEKLLLSFSANGHYQNSIYGTTSYNAQQYTGFMQLTWDKTVKQQDWLAGIAMRYTYYDDNTVATFNNFSNSNKPDKILLPGIFLQNELTLHTKHKLLLGLRYDYHSIHQSILTPRIAYKWQLNTSSMLRVNAGTGFRVVNLFTEDHAALTGARTVEITEALQPEKSYNVSLNYNKTIVAKKVTISVDANAWYTYFTNKIVPDYETDVNKIIYNNLNGFAESSGITLNTDASFSNGIKLSTGITLMNVQFTENKVRQRQLLTEQFSGTWSVAYNIKSLKLLIDYTGNIYGPMKLPLLGELDPREPYSPTWSTQNIQFTYTGSTKWQLYAGVKNLLNWTPFKTNNPFIIARPNDPFDKQVQFNSTGQVVATPENPHALTFDPNYVYAPLQGLRVFVGVRLTVR